MKKLRQKISLSKKGFLGGALIYLPIFLLEFIKTYRLVEEYNGSITYAKLLPGMLSPLFLTINLISGMLVCGVVGMVINYNRFIDRDVGPVDYKEKARRLFHVLGNVVFYSTIVLVTILCMLILPFALTMVLGYGSDVVISSLWYLILSPLSFFIVPLQLNIIIDELITTLIFQSLLYGILIKLIRNFIKN